jgi:hypothetical protein
MERSADIDGLIARMEALLVQLRERGDGNRHFLATYLRTTRAVRDELAAGGFLDPYLGGAVGRRLRRPVPGRIGGRTGTKRFLKEESRAKVWANTRLLSQVRRAGPAAYQARLAEPERLAAARVADLVAPGQVVLKLAVRGFGVRLPRRQAEPRRAC